MMFNQPIPFNPARYPDEPYDVYALRRWTENLLFKWREKPVTLYYSDYEVDRRGRKIPYENSKKERRY